MINRIEGNTASGQGSPVKVKPGLLRIDRKSAVILALSGEDDRRSTEEESTRRTVGRSSAGMAYKTTLNGAPISIPQTRGPGRE